VCVFVIMLYFILLYSIFTYILKYLYKLLFVCNMFSFRAASFNKFELS